MSVKAWEVQSTRFTILERMEMGIRNEIALLFAWDIGALMGEKIFDSIFPEVAATGCCTQWLFMGCYE